MTDIRLPGSFIPPDIVFSSVKLIMAVGGSLTAELLDCNEIDDQYDNTANNVKIILETLEKLKTKKLGQNLENVLTLCEKEYRWNREEARCAIDEATSSCKNQSEQSSSRQQAQSGNARRRKLPEDIQDTSQSHGSEIRNKSTKKQGKEKYYYYW